MQDSSRDILNDVFTHFVYICCSTADAKIAKRLKKSIQVYRLPVKVQRLHRTLPHRCRPVFMNSNPKANDSLPESLKSSKYFVMVCSKHARSESDAMDRELRTFLENGGNESRVFPFIVDDSRNPVEECFPMLLASLGGEENIVGVNIHDGGVHTAIIKLIAAMLGLKVEELESAEARRKKHSRISTAILAAMLMIAAMGYWEYSRPKTAYYLDFTEIYGVPIGIGKLQKLDTDGMYCCFAITRSGGLVRELTVKPGAGDLFDHGILFDEDDKPLYYEVIRPEILFSRALYSYNDKRKLQSVDYYDVSGTLLLTKNYINVKTVDISQPAKNQLLPSNAIRRLLLEYDSKGYLVEVRYVGDRTNNLSISDDNGIFGLRYVRDKLGRPIRKVNLVNSSGIAEFSSTYREEKDDEGILAREYLYGENNELIGFCFLGDDGTPVPGSEGYAALEMRYDVRHNVEQLFFLRPNGASWQTEGGFCALKLVYGPQGEVCEHHFLDVEGKPVIGEDGYSGDRATFENRVVKQWEYLGLNGEPVVNRRGFSSYTVEVDFHSMTEYMTFYGLDGSPVVTDYGIAARESQYTDAHNIIYQKYFNVDGEPMLDQYGVAGYTQTFDAWGCVKSLTYLGLEGEPIKNRTYNYCTRVNDYNTKGQIERQSFYDTDGKPMLHANRYASVTTAYNAQGNDIDVHYYGTDGMPIRTIHGLHECIKIYDRKGNYLSEEYYDENGIPLTRSCVIAFYEADTPEEKDLYGGIILLRLGDWAFSGTHEDFEEAFRKGINEKQTVDVEYLAYNRDAQRFERYHAEFEYGRMGMRLCNYNISEAEYAEIMDAAQDKMQSRSLSHRRDEVIVPWDMH